MKHQTRSLIGSACLLVLIAAAGVGTFTLLVGPGGQGTAQGATTTTCVGYPGCVTTTTAAPAIVTQNIGNFPQGAAPATDSCGFQPGSTVSETVNGTPVGTTTVPASGCVAITIQFTKVTSTGGTVSVNGVSVSVSMSNNVLSVVGTGSNGAGLTVNTVFGLTTPSGLAFTGIDLLRWGGLAASLIGIGIILLLVDVRRRKR